MTKIKVSKYASHNNKSCCLHSTVYGHVCQGTKPKMSVGSQLVTYVDDWITTAVHYRAHIKGHNS